MCVCVSVYIHVSIYIICRRGVVCNGLVWCGVGCCNIITSLIIQPSVCGLRCCG